MELYINMGLFATFVVLVVCTLPKYHYYMKLKFILETFFIFVAVFATGMALHSTFFDLDFEILRSLILAFAVALFRFLAVRKSYEKK